jgi:hypothetical protein
MLMAEVLGNPFICVMLQMKRAGFYVIQNAETVQWGMAQSAGKPANLITKISALSVLRAFKASTPRNPTVEQLVRQ